MEDLLSGLGDHCRYVASMDTVLLGTGLEHK